MSHYLLPRLYRLTFLLTLGVNAGTFPTNALLNDTAAAGAGLRFGQNTYFTGNVIDVIFIKFPFSFY